MLVKMVTLAVYLKVSSGGVFEAETTGLINFQASTSEVNASFSEMDVSPMNRQTIPKPMHVSHCKRKLNVCQQSWVFQKMTWLKMPVVHHCIIQN